MTGHLIVSDEDATRVITLRRPEKKNAITQDMYRAMSDAIDKAQNNPDIRCIIITGGSGVFTAGNDLEDFLKDGTSSSDAPRASNAWSARASPAFASLRSQRCSRLFDVVLHGASPCVAQLCSRVRKRVVEVRVLDWCSVRLATTAVEASVLWVALARHPGRHGRPSAAFAALAAREFDGVACSVAAGGLQR